MQLIRDTYRKTGAIHHAYVIVGERHPIASKLLEFLSEDLDFQIQGNPDYWHESFESFGVEECRLVKEMHLRKSWNGGRKVFIISAETITREAQNALLKILEEPRERNHFFILLSSAENLLPTLLSRIVLIEERGVIETSLEPKEFLKKSLPERFKIIKNFVQRDEEESENGSRGEAVAFLNNLEKYLYEAKKTTPEIFEEIIKCRNYLHDRSSSVKMLLEQIAITI